MGEEGLRKAASWCGFSASLCTFVLGIIHICFISVSIVWPSSHEKVTTDVNTSWRLRLFTFAPDAMCDIWTPVVMGLIGMVVHLTQYNCKTITDNYVRFFIYHFLTGLFGALGYRGGLGILVSIPLWLCCLLSLMCAFTCDGNASLRLETKMPFSSQS